MKNDPVNHPNHYCFHPSGVECIQISGEMNFALGNAFKYLFRIGEKGDALQDAKKALWYLEHEIERREKFRFRWFAEDNDFDARRDGSFDIVQVLEFEYRYSGWLTSAMERIYTASVHPRGVEALHEAVRKVHNIITIQQQKDSQAV